MEHDDALYCHRYFNILRALMKRVLDEYDKKVGEYELTFTQLHLLYHVYLHKGMSLSELSWKLRLDNSVVTGLVKRLEAKKLISSQTSAEDRRVSIVYLTEKGYNLRQKIEKSDNIPFFSFLLRQPPHKKEKLLNDLVGIYQDIWPGQDHRFLAYIFNSDPWENQE